MVRNGLELMRSHKKLIIAGGLNLGIVTAVTWWLVNQFWVFGGVGRLQQQPWPLSSIYACTGIGTALGLGLGVILARRNATHTDRVARLAQSWGFQCVPEVTRAQLPACVGLQLFEPRRWHEAKNVMSGRLDGLDVTLLDYEFVEHGDDSTTHYRQTVALFREGARGLPPFELVPRDLIIRLFYRAAGLEGITFEPDETVGGLDHGVIEQFRDSYFLSPPLYEVRCSSENRRAMSEQNQLPVREGQPKSSESAIRRLFNLDIVRFFVDRPGWSVESDGGDLAVWRSGKVIPTRGRDQFVRDAGDVRSALGKAASGAWSAPTVPGTLKMDLRAVKHQERAWTIGAFIGFFVGGSLGMASSVALLSADQEPPLLLLATVFFACPIIGLFVGGLISCRRQRQATSNEDPSSQVVKDR